MELRTSFSQKVFASQIPDVIVFADCSRVHVVIRFADRILYEENLFPDSNMLVTIRELSNLVMPFARKLLVATLDISLTAQNITVSDIGEENVEDISSSSLSTSVVYSTAEVSEDAKTFCETHFLSRLQGAKQTAVGRLEYLHYDSTDDASVTAVYDDNSTAVFLPPKVGGNGSYSTIDVSPEQYVDKNKKLLYFTVTAGNRSQIFEMLPSSPDAAPVLLFTNSFGCQELAYCTGTHATSADITRSRTYILSQLRDYDIEEVRNFDADTGCLTFPMAAWFSDVFRSDEIYLVNFVDGEPDVGRRIVIKSQEIGYTNDDDELPRFTFSYSYAQRNHNIIDTEHAGRIFDNTFDFTFN